MRLIPGSKTQGTADSISEDADTAAPDSLETQVVPVSENLSSVLSVDEFLGSTASGHDGDIDDYAHRQVLPVAMVPLPNSRADAVRRLLMVSELPRGRRAESFQKDGEEGSDEEVAVLPRRKHGCTLLSDRWLNSYIDEDEGEGCSALSSMQGKSYGMSYGEYQKSHADSYGVGKGSLFSSQTTRCSLFSSVATHPHFASVTQQMSQQSIVAKEMGIHAFAPARVVGKGSYGTVCQVVRKKTNHHYAMKIQDKMSIVKARGELGLQQARMERDVLCSIKHPYIVPLFWSFQTANHLIFVMKLCPGGDLTTLIQQLKRIHPAQSCLYTAQVLLALCHLHDRRLIHRDVKPDNILIDEEGHALLSDFGISKGGINGPTDASTFCGTPAFCAPEVLKREGYGRGIDVWGLGLLNFNMLTGELPFQGEEVWLIKQSICSGKFNIPSTVPKDAESFIRRTMEKKTSKRLGTRCTADVKDHGYFRAMDWDALMRREVPLSKLGLRQRIRRKFKSTESKQEITDAVAEAKTTFTNIQRCRKSQGQVAHWDYCMLEPELEVPES